MENKILVFGHKKPDTDSVTTAIVVANLQNELGNEAKACMLGNINRETEFALKYFNVELPQIISKVEENQDVIIVDCNEFSQTAEGVENANIKLILDHHRLNIQTNNPISCMIEPVGCSATLAYKLYKQNDIEISKQMAGLMLSAIISDTLLFKSPTLTPEDKRVAGLLSQIAEVNIEEYGLELLKAGTNLDGYSAKDIINTDSKTFEQNGVEITISQINTADVDNVLEKQEELECAINKEIENNNLNLYIFVITDIINATSVAIALGERTDLINKAFDVELKNNVCVLKDVVSRKKQVLPKILDVIK